jgi:small-conductance mechanosensitive channel
MENLLQETLVPWLTTSGLQIIIIIAVALVILKVSKAAITTVIRRAISNHDELDPTSERKREDTLIGIFQFLVRIIVYIVAAMMVLSEFGIDVGPLLAGAGIVGVALGFGSQYLVRDLISGFFMILENQFRIGDVISVNGVSGKIENISLRITTLRNMEGTVHYIPNGEITVLSNMTKGFSRMDVIVGISYHDDINNAIKVINKVGQDIANDENWKTKIIKAPEFLRVQELNSSSVDLRVMADTLSGEQWAVAGEFRKRIKEAFDAEKIEIPFPQQVVIRKDS